jgi:Flp pilus assembly protein TadG/uncharacterized Zn-binding protein involved in type VI secretion
VPENFQLFKQLENKRGVTIIVVALLIIVFLAFAALAVDIFHIVVVRNELRNAADAGSLAGVRFLYNDNGTEINEGANQIAYDAAIANKSEKVPVEVNWSSGGNIGTDVERGHWSFSTSTFTPNDSLLPVDLWDKTTAELDQDTNFINAVRVKTKRESTPAASFFAKILGYENFLLSSEAVAYIGFAGELRPKDVDQPIAICKEALLISGKYTCTVGRMINSGGNVASHETGGWTDFSQEGDPCQGGTNANTVKDLVCGSGNPKTIILGNPVATNGGEIQSAFNDLINCWETKSNGKTQPWTLTLPVIECPGNNITTCQKVVGAVTISIVWITGAGNDPHYKEAPIKMGSWSSNDPDGQVRWNSFRDYFNLKNVDGSPAPYDNQSIYFLPDCEAHIPIGKTGGENFGILARIPVLVK